MNTRYLLIVAFLFGCQTNTMYEPVWEDLEFEWVEPLVFQQNWMQCRSQPVCRAETLFN